MTLKLVVLSDLHIVPEGETSLGLDTTARLVAGIEAINSRHADADLVVIAGDLADNGDAASYGRLARALAALKPPVAITIGNHDDRAAYLDRFGADQAAETGFVDLVRDVKGYRIILLDSAIEHGRHDGRLEPSQLTWLSDRLDEAADRPVIVILHHHANPLSTAVDQIILQNGPDLVAVLRRHPDVRQVIAGHVHYTSTAIWHGLPFTTLAGSHYSVTIPLDGSEPALLAGPAQMAVVLGDADQTLIHFDNYMDGHAILT
jgi:3',5'-cyclic AMP phosphodiesterase CpdA